MNIYRIEQPYYIIKQVIIMEIDCKLGLLTCDIDQFYLVLRLRLFGNKNIFNFAEVYNMRWIKILNASCANITTRVKSLIKLRYLDNQPTNYTGYQPPTGCPIVLNILLAMNIQFCYGYFRNDSLPRIKTGVLHKSSIFPGLSCLERL